MSTTISLRLALALFAAAPAVAAAQPITLRIESALAEPDGTSAAPAVSGNGKVVVFRSLATNLTEASGSSTLFAYDVLDDSIEALAPTANGNIFDPAVSVDGRHVAFETTATNLAPGLDSSFSDVLRLDRETGLFQRASQGVGGSKANGGSAHAAISGDGRSVGFTSLATNLVTPSTSGSRRHVYLMDMDSGVVELVSAAPDGSEGDGDAQALEANAMSSDGRRIVFASSSENIAPVSDGNVADVFVATRAVGGGFTYEMVNRSMDGALGTQSSSRGSISPNGRYVVFRSSAQNISAEQPGDSNLFVRDLDRDTVRVLPLPTGYMTCDRARVGDRGEVVMQCAPAGNGSTALQVFLVPADGGVPRLMSKSTAGVAGNATSGQGFTMNADTTLLAIESAATDLIEVDTNLAGDVFLIAEADVFDRIFRDGFED